MGLRAMVFAGLAFAAIVILAVVVITSDRRSPAARAHELARGACSEMREVVEGARRDVAAARVTDALDDAAAAAAAAADLDPRWRSLSGGVAAVRFAFREDDAEAARVGIVVVTRQCREAGAAL